MAAPSVSTDATAIGSGMGNAVAANATVYPGVVNSSYGTDFGSARRLFGNSGARFQGGAGWSSPRYEGGGWNISIDGTTGVVFTHFRFESVGGIDTTANNGFVIAMRSGVGNWRRWTVGGSDSSPSDYPHGTDNNYMPIAVAPASPGDFADDGTFNPASIDRLEVHAYRAASATYNFTIAKTFFVTFANIADGELADPATLGPLADYFDGDGATFESLSLIGLGSGLYHSYIPMGIAAAYFDQDFSVEFAGAGLASVKLNADSIGFDVSPAASSTLNLVRSKIASSRGFSIDLDDSPTTTATINNLFISGPGGTTLNVTLQEGGLYFGRDAFSISSGTFQGTSFAECGLITLSGTATLTNPVINNSTDANGALSWDGTNSITGASFSGNTAAIALPDGVTAVTLDNNSFSGNTYDFRVENTGGTVTITTDTGSTTDHPGGFSDAGYVAAKVQIVNGASVVFSVPQASLTFNDCPLNTEIRVYSLDAPGDSGNVLTEIGGIENTVSNTFVVNYSGSYDLRIVLLNEDFEYVVLYESVTGNDLTFPVGALLKGDRVFDNPV